MYAAEETRRPSGKRASTRHTIGVPSADVIGVDIDVPLHDDHSPQLTIVVSGIVVYDSLYVIELDDVRCYSLEDRSVSIVDT